MSIACASVIHVITDKKLALVTLLNFLSVVVVACAFLFCSTQLYAQALTGAVSGFALLFYIIVIALVFYLMLSCVMVFFGVVIAYSTLHDWQGKPVTVREAFVHAFKKLPMIIQWGICRATYGYSFTVLATPAEELEPVKIATTKPLESLGAIIDYPWGVATYLAIPVLTFESVHLTSCVKNSLKLFKDTFGLPKNSHAPFLMPTIIVFSFGICLLIRAVIAKSPTSKFSIALLLWSLFLTLFLLCLLYAAKIVFRTAVYASCKNLPTGPFSRETIKKAL